jgi:hypothetical protein
MSTAHGPLSRGGVKEIWDWVGNSTEDAESDHPIRHTTCRPPIIKTILDGYHAINQEKVE